MQRAGAREKVVVVGAGLGGLAVALRLAHAGLDVEVVERLDAPGGKLRTIPSPAGPVDAGPTVLTLRPVFEALFAVAGASLADHVTLVPEPVLARHWWPDGSRLDLVSDREANAAAIRAFAGRDAAAAFRAFDERAALLFDAFDATVMRAASPSLPLLAKQVAASPSLAAAVAPFRTLAGSLGRTFRDPRLAQLFGRYATYVGGFPDASPALLALIWHAEARGVWRVAGGMHRLAVAIEAVAKAGGARFHYGADVQRVEVAGGRVGAVRLADGRRLAADIVVFNGDPAALHAGLLGDGVADAVPGSAVLPRALSAYVWSFAAPAPAFDLGHHNVLFATDPAGEFHDIGRGRMPADPTLYVCAQDRGAGAGAAGAERFEIIVNAPAGRAPAEREFETCRERTVRVLSRMGLGALALPERAGLTTPTDFAALFPGSGGSLYGRSPHGLDAAFRRPTARSAVPGLYLAGGGVHPGPGMPMATLSGGMAADAVLADLASTSRSRRTAMPGGTSTGSPPTASGRSRSSAS